MLSQEKSQICTNLAQISRMLLLCFLMFLPNFGFANVNKWGKVYNLSKSDLAFDQEVFNKSRSFIIEIPADLISDEQINVKFKKLAKNKYVIPAEYKAVSNIYRYEITNSLDNFVLLDEIELYLNYKSETLGKKSLFYWDPDSKAWTELKSQSSAISKLGKISKIGKGIVNAKTDLEGLDVVVLEKLAKPSIVEPKKKAGAIDPAIYSLASALVDVKSGKVMFCKDCNRKLTLASMTKIVTADVVVDLSTDFEKIYTYQYYDDAEGQSVWLSSGDKIKVRDLFYTSLVKSANNATRALAHSTGLNDAEFAVKMNQKAKQVGANSCSFYDPTGLDWRNACSPIDYSKVAIDALKKFKISQAASTKAYSYYTENGKYIGVTNTNSLLNSNLYVLGGKTGYLPEIGMNLMTKVRGKNGQELIAVVIGASSYYQVTNEVERLLRWGLENWTW